MSNRFLNSVLLTSLLVAGLVPNIFAAVPGLISYQGRLTTPAGIPVPDTVYQMKFQIYDVASGGVALWNSQFRKVQVTSGLYTYVLGQDVPFPNGVFDGGICWLGVTVGADSEMSPRHRIVSSAFALQSGNSDELENKPASYYLSWNNLNNVPAGFADNTDNIGSGDITEVVAGAGLQGGALSGAASLDIEPSGVTSEMIANSTIVNADISGAAAISPTKISGTAATLNSNQSFAGRNTFLGEVAIGAGVSPDQFNTLQLRREAGFASTTYAIDIEFLHPTNGIAYGLNSLVSRAAGQFGTTHGIYSMVESDGFSRYGISGFARTVNAASATGSTYGVYGYAADGNEAFGVYGFAMSATNNYAGYFDGNVNVTGTLTTPAKVTLIDHPLDPENQLLQLAGVDSPESKTVYDGVVITDNSGEATVELPAYAGSLNVNFRYQLTVIGDFAQAVIAREIVNGSFLIRTDKPGVKVSWQVTGVRNDPFTRTNARPNEMAKKTEDRGKYLHPAAYGMPDELGVDYKHRLLQESNSE